MCCLLDAALTILVQAFVIGLIQSSVLPIPEATMT